jgi:diphthamide synthase (EF-2-diphthine--ammonia ligase)
MESHMADQSQAKSLLVSWSGGKDSCMALHEVQRTGNIRWVTLSLDTATEG